MAFSLAFTTSSPAFYDGHGPRASVACILREAADAIEARDDDGTPVSGAEGTCRDGQGRIVGNWRLVGHGK